MPSNDDLQRLVDFEGKQDPELRRGVRPALWHLGPAVVDEFAGPQRFIPKLHATYDESLAAQLAGEIQAHYRWPGSEGYAASLDRLEGLFTEAGFGGADARLELRRLAPDELDSGWTLVEARVDAAAVGAATEQLHAYSHGDRSESADRWVAPLGAPAFEVEGRVIFQISDLQPGDVLVTAEPAWRLADRAAMRGAAGLLSGHLPTGCIDPTGAEAHLDAVASSEWNQGESLPRLQISPRSLARLRDMAEGGEARVRLTNKVESAPKVAGSLAVICRGSRYPDQSVVLCAHLDGLGANGNASGVAGLTASALATAQLLREGSLEQPHSSVVFLFGPRNAQVEHWQTGWSGSSLAAISVEGPGLSSGLAARALLERPADPACIRALAPDRRPNQAVPGTWLSAAPASGLAVVARCALHDVGRHEGSWSTTDQPFEGVGDSAEFVRSGVPAARLRRESDFAAGTSLDRLERVDARELRRSSVAALATGWALGSALPDDLDRYLRTLSEETRVRIQAARGAGDAGLTEAWREWHLGAQAWLRVLCLGPDASLEASTSSSPDESTPLEASLLDPRQG